LAKGLARLMGDRAKREQLGSAARIKAEEFRAPVIADRMLHDFDNLLRH